jgi:hypothetical protein
MKESDEAIEQFWRLPTQTVALTIGRETRKT